MRDGRHATRRRAAVADPAAREGTRDRLLSFRPAARAAPERSCRDTVEPGRRAGRGSGCHLVRAGSARFRVALPDRPDPARRPHPPAGPRVSLRHSPTRDSARTSESFNRWAIDLVELRARHVLRARGLRRLSAGLPLLPLAGRDRRETSSRRSPASRSKSTTYTLLKLPGILADLGIAILLYWEARRWLGERAGLIAAALFLFIPFTWYESAALGPDRFGRDVLPAGLAAAPVSRLERAGGGASPPSRSSSSPSTRSSS